MSLDFSILEAVLFPAILVSQVVVRSIWAVLDFVAFDLFNLPMG